MSLQLLLCGAFVASKSATTSNPNVPRMPDDVIAASTTVLDNIFKDAGVSHPASAGHGVHAQEPMPSQGAWPGLKKSKCTTQGGQSIPACHSASANEMVGLSGSSLDGLSHRLLKPSREQERDQLYSLSAEQYNHVTSTDFLDMASTQQVSTTEDLSHLGAGLGSVAPSEPRNKASSSSMAEVYTRSLMWDRVPAEVVREFARFVADSEALARQTKSELDTA